MRKKIALRFQHRYGPGLDSESYISQVLMKHNPHLSILFKKRKLKIK